jgi:hypothetical protein
MTAARRGSRAAEQAEQFLSTLLPSALSSRVNFRVGHYMVVMLSLCALLATVMGMVYMQETAFPLSGALSDLLHRRL